MEIFSALQAFMRGIHRSPVNSPHKGQWRRALMFSLICGWADNRDAGDLWRHRVHYDVIVMCHFVVRNKTVMLQLRNKINNEILVLGLSYFSQAFNKMLLLHWMQQSDGFSLSSSLDILTICVIYQRHVENIGIRYNHIFFISTVCQWHLLSSSNFMNKSPTSDGSL